MKRSEIIKKALNHELNTVCVNEAQVESMLELFEKLGMMPPPATEGVIKIQELENGELCIPIWGWESEE
jgi:hypothetical protein